MASKDYSGSKPKLLIVDDDPMVLQSTSAIFTYNGFEVFSCENSFLALESIKEQTPDVVLTDVRMPDISGTDLLLKLRAEGHDFPIIVMTGYTDLSSAIDAVKGGAFDFVKKPYDPEYLIKTVQRAVKHCRLLALEKSYLGQLEYEVRQKTEEIERSSRLKTEFLNNISHEIRTPANGIVGLIDLARHTDERDEMLSYLDQAESSAIQLVKIVTDLVTLSGVVTGSLKPGFYNCSINNLLQKACQQIMDLYSVKQECFQVEITPDVPERLVLEANLVETALFHLLENIIKFAPDSKALVNIDYVPEQGLLLIKISDTGPGMDIKQLRKASEIFVQGDGSFTRQQNGLGIGLNIVEKIAAFLGGRFKLTSHPGNGTSAMLVFPAQQPL